jgi:hypothetical protein
MGVAVGGAGVDVLACPADGGVELGKDDAGAAGEHAVIRVSKTSKLSKVFFIMFEFSLQDPERAPFRSDRGKGNHL